MLSGPLQSESFTDTPAARGQVIIIIIDVVVSSRSTSSRRRSRRTRTPTRRLRLRPRFRRSSSIIGTLEIHMSAVLVAVRSVATMLTTFNLTPIAAVASGRAKGRANRNPELRKQSRTKADELALGWLSGLLIHDHPLKCDAQFEDVCIQHVEWMERLSIEAEPDPLLRCTIILRPYEL